MVDWVIELPVAISEEMVVGAKLLDKVARARLVLQVAEMAALVPVDHFRVAKVALGVRADRNTRTVRWGTFRRGMAEASPPVRSHP